MELNENIVKYFWILEKELS